MLIPWPVSSFQDSSDGLEHQTQATLLDCTFTGTLPIRPQVLSAYEALYQAYCVGVQFK